MSHVIFHSLKLSCRVAMSATKRAVKMRPARQRSRAASGVPLAPRIVPGAGASDEDVAARQHTASIPERRLFGRGVAFPADKFPAGACLCARPRAIVFCRGCGYFRAGRKRIQCPQHPGVLFLYDVVACERCNLACYLDEYDLPQ